MRTRDMRLKTANTTRNSQKPKRRGHASRLRAKNASLFHLLDSALRRRNNNNGRRHQQHIYPARPRPWNLSISFHVIRFFVSVLLCSVLSYTSIDSNMAPAFPANFHLAFLGPNVSSLARARDPSYPSPGPSLRSSIRSESTSLFLPRAGFRSSGLGTPLSSLLDWADVQRRSLSRSSKGKGSSSETGLFVSSNGLDWFAS